MELLLYGLLIVLGVIGLIYALTLKRDFDYDEYFKILGGYYTAKKQGDIKYLFGFKRPKGYNPPPPRRVC